MKAISPWAGYRADQQIRIEGDQFMIGPNAESCDPDHPAIAAALKRQRRWFARELDRARELGKADATRFLEKAAREMEALGEDATATICRHVKRYVKATA